MFMIRNHKHMYYSVHAGWTNKTLATRFDEEDTKEFPLPANGEWVTENQQRKNRSTTGRIVHNRYPKLYYILWYREGEHKEMFGLFYSTMKNQLAANLKEFFEFYGLPNAMYGRVNLKQRYQHMANKGTFGVWFVLSDSEGRAVVFEGLSQAQYEKVKAGLDHHELA